MEKLIDFVDKKAKEEFGDYYIVSKLRMDNIRNCFIDGAKRIEELTEIIKKQQDKIKALSLNLTDIEKMEADHA